MNDPIRWGILGCGDVTERKSGPALQKADGSELVAVMRRDGDKAADYARRHGVPRWYDDADALIADPGVDAVYVATPPGSHLELSLKVAGAGKPCYVEKPMARSAAECRAMNEAFDAAGVKLFVAYYRRRLPRTVKAKELIDAGRLGRVSSVRYHFSRRFDPDASAGWRTAPAVSGGGLFLDLASHLLDALDELLGPLLSVAGVASNVGRTGDVEDAVSMSFVTAGGAVGAASWNFAASSDADALEIAGTAATLSFGCFDQRPMTLKAADGEAESFDLTDPPHVQQPLIQTVVDDLLGRGTCPSTGGSAARTSAVMDAVLNDYYGGRGDAFWDRPSKWPGQSRRRF